MHELTKLFELFEIQETDVLLVHSSLKGLNFPKYININKLIETMISFLYDGTLCMPAFDYMNVIDAHKTWSIDKSSGMGIISEIFRQKFATHRSNNPTHSIACIGTKAEFITSQPLTDKRIGPFGNYCFSLDSAFDKLYQLKAKILFLGVDTRKNTFKHYVEYKFVNDVINSMKDVSIKQDAVSELLTYDYILNNSIKIPDGEVVPKKTGKVWPWSDSKDMENEMIELGILKSQKFNNTEVYLIDNSYVFSNWLYNKFYKEQAYINEAAKLWAKKYIDIIKERGKTEC